MRDAKVIIILKSMGSTYDNVCKPAGECTCCPVELSDGDKFYDPPQNLIVQFTSGQYTTSACVEGNHYHNLASGVKYIYQNGIMVATGFITDNQAYCIYGEINGNVLVPVGCTNNCQALLRRSMDCLVRPSDRVPTIPQFLSPYGGMGQIGLMQLALWSADNNRH